MENTLIRIDPIDPVRPVTSPGDTDSRTFITSNTIPCSVEVIRDHHLIPVFVKDNETVISHHDFINTTIDVVRKIYSGEDILEPMVRLSHPIKGRIPEAKDKAANQLQEWEKTVYYERMMFCIEIPSIQETIDGNILSLTIGGVKSYSLDNLYSKKGAPEHFKIFVIGSIVSRSWDMIIFFQLIVNSLVACTNDNIRRIAYHNGFRDILSLLDSKSCICLLQQLLKDCPFPQVRHIINISSIYCHSYVFIISFDTN